MIDLRRIRYFTVLAEELHFGHAALRLGISQPPLSQQIRALERDLDVQLFARNNRRVELSPAGAAFLPEARRLLEQAERAASIAQRAQSGELGEIRVGFTPSAAFGSIIPGHIREFHRRFPEVHLSLQEMTSHRQFSAIMEHRLDVGFVRSQNRPDLPPSIEVRHLVDDPLVVVLPPGHPLGRREGSLSVAALAEEMFVMYPRDIGTGVYEQIMAMCRRAGFAPRIAQEASETPTMIGLVTAGLGVAIVPASLGIIRINGVVFRPLRERGARSAMWMVLRTERSPQEALFAELAGAPAPG